MLNFIKIVTGTASIVLLIIGALSVISWISPAGDRYGYMLAFVVCLVSLSPLAFLPKR